MIVGTVGIVGLVSRTVRELVRVKRPRGVVAAVCLSLTATGLALAPVAPASANSAAADPVVEISDGTEIDPGPLPQDSVPSPPRPGHTGKGRLAVPVHGMFASAAADDVDANNIMRGYARVAQYGTLQAPEESFMAIHPRSTTAAMATCMRFLMLPLLRVGLRTGNQAMVKRFYALMFDWIKDNPPKRPRQE